MMKHLLHKFLDQGIDWLFRRRNPGFVLVGAGIPLLIAVLGADYLMQLDYQDGGRSFAFKFATGQGLPGWASLSGLCMGLLLTLFGIGLILYRFISDAKKENRQLQVVVELRGLHGVLNTSAKDADIGLPVRGAKQAVVVDFRPQSTSDLVNPTFMLEQMQSIKSTVDSLAAGRDSNDVFVAVGGLAAVPALFLAGVMFNDASTTTVYDWDRGNKRWRAITGPDDGARFLPLDTGQLKTMTEEVVLAVSISYAVDNEAIASTFSSLPVTRLALSEPLADRHWSQEKQIALVAAFRDSVQLLMARGVKTIHLVLAAPASVAIQMGMAYDARLMPTMLVYQYEKSHLPPYPWALKMPVHGTANAALIVTAPPSSDASCRRF